MFNSGTYFFSNDIHKLDNGKLFDIVFDKRNGERVEARGVVMTSFYSKGLTMNLKCPGYDYPITLRRSQVISINGKELIL